MARVSGNVAAALMSGWSWLLTHSVYGVLRIIYRRDMRVMALYAAILAAIVLLVRWIF
ncbi:hypothetical protein OF829_14135 [Sphingomonas sp. LB-2]|uniref:hypothetical protein n=1 Tax=Sphingomonas caeni TaxID=2984949 RepID=UPI0022307BF3|nr:hypothetical protein [Sphingomonas caeni]MCW3848379.1 hypothetical protein [Sphingomonas caeni]